MLLDLEAYFENEKLHIKVDGELESTRSQLMHGKAYKFTHKGRDYYYCYEETEEQIILFFYPLNAFENRIIKIEK